MSSDLAFYGSWGAAMAIEDAAVLAGCLRFCGEGQGEESVRAALLRYENLRKVELLVSRGALEAMAGYFTFRVLEP